MKKILVFIGLVIAISISMISIPFVSFGIEVDPEIHKIDLSVIKSSDGHKNIAKIDGNKVKEYDYTWHADPSTVHNEVKNCPAEYYTGTKPEDTEAIYIAHDIKYIPQLDRKSFKSSRYNGQNEWLYFYPVDAYSEYIFATLPRVENDFPEYMMHSEEEAYENAVLHINEPGTYEIEGEWHGQIWVDLGDQEDTYSDEKSKVKVILNGVDITCTVAPAVVFYSAYECDNEWEKQTSWTYDVDTSDAGVNVIIADGSENNIKGENVYRMLKTKYKDNQNNSGSRLKLQKKARKIDAAFYSYVSLNINGEEKGDGILNITSGFEGIGSEHHLTINGGNINVFSQDDAINVNEDDVSVLTINGGTVHLSAGLGLEGDGVDSNGYLVINGGTVIAIGSPLCDSGLDSNCGSYINGGTIVALGSDNDWVEPDASSKNCQSVINLSFEKIRSYDKSIIVTDTDNKVVFAYNIADDELGYMETKGYRGVTISSPDIKRNSRYYIYSGGNVVGSDVMGIYDISSIESITDDAKLQRYTRVWNDGEDEQDINPSVIFTTENIVNNFGKVNDFYSIVDKSHYSDVSDNDWYKESVDFVSIYGLMNGTGSMEFSPMNKLTRGMVVTILYRMSNSDNNSNGGTNSFSDVKSDAYYFKAVEWASSNGLVNGYDKNRFGPEDYITREQLAAIIYRYNSISETEHEELSSDSLEKYQDFESISNYAIDAFKWTNANGIITGDEKEMLLPKGFATRAEAATVFMRYSKMSRD